MPKKQAKTKPVFSKPKVIARGKESSMMNSCGRAGCQGK